jgi:nucleoside-diphosphate-sugar epimerase
MNIALTGGNGCVGSHVLTNLDAYGHSGKPFVPISGIWVYGNNTDITEASPENAPALVAWKGRSAD